jgi:hypothetical protein
MQQSLQGRLHSAIATAAPQGAVCRSLRCFGEAFCLAESEHHLPFSAISELNLEVDLI